MHTLVAKVTSIQGPESLPNGGVKYYVSLSDGSSVVTFSKNCSKNLMMNMENEIEFTLEAPPSPTMTPRIEKAVLVIGGAVLYDRAAAAAKAAGYTGGGGSQQAGGGGANFYQDETTRAVEFAFAYLAAWNAAVVAKGGEPMPMDLFVAKLSDLANVAHEQVLELRKEKPSTTALKEEAAEKFATIPAGWS